MKVKAFLEKLERRSSISKARLEARGIFTGSAVRGINRFGIPKRVTKFMKEYNWASWSQNGDVEGFKKEICRFWANNAEIKPEHVKLGAGSMRVLQYIDKLFLETGAKVLGYAPQFYGYPVDVMASGAIYDAVLLDPDNNYRFNAEVFIENIKPDYSLIYIDNPNNPTGQLINLQDIESIVKAAKAKDIAVIVDEAYFDCIDKDYSAINLHNKYDNLVITRTFTKGYKLGPRVKIGYGILPEELSSLYDKIDFPPSISNVDVLMAKEALLDNEFIPYLKNQIRTIKKDLIEGLTSKGYTIAETTDTCEVFVLIHRNKDFDLWEYLLDKEVPSLPLSYFYSSPNMGINCVRVTTPSNAREFLERIQ